MFPFVCLLRFGIRRLELLACVSQVVANLFDVVLDQIEAEIELGAQLLVVLERARSMMMLMVRGRATLNRRRRR